MAQCAFCQIHETELYDGGTPICIECSEKRDVKRKPPNNDQIKTTLVGRIAETTARVSAANQAFNEVIGQTPSAPHPDGVQRIKNASNALTLARADMLQAHRRLNDFIEHGTVPEDLKGTP